MELSQPDSRAAVWSHRTEGVAQNYGRPANAENYQETVNRALERAVTNAVNNKELRQRLYEVQSRVALDSP